MLDFIKDLLGINRYHVVWTLPFPGGVTRGRRSYHKWRARERAKRFTRIFETPHWIERA